MKRDPRIAKFGDWLSAAMGPAPALEALVAKIPDVPVNDRRRA